MYRTRTAEQMILDVSRSFPSIVIYGPRQVGKSTLVNRLFGDSFPVVTLDDVDDRTLAQQNPKVFLDSYGWPLIIDEIQKAPGLLDEIKVRIDRQRAEWLNTGESRQLMYVLTGSKQFELQEGISDSLAGRCGVIDLNSFTQAEKYGMPGTLFTPDMAELLKRERQNRSLPARSRREIFQDIFAGGMPDICTGVAERNAYFKSYIETYLEKDVRKLIAASHEVQFRNFMGLLALRTGQELHYDRLANEAGINTVTCKRWISILKTSGIIFLLHPYMANLSNRIIKAPKVYFMDTGLCAYLCKWPTAEMLEEGAMGGAFFETYVVSELVKNLYAYNMDPSDTIYYYRDTNQKEVDLLYIRGGAIYPIEVKKGLNPTKATKNFSVLQKYNMPIETGLVIDTCDKIRPINEQAFYFPIWELGL